jgi:hypothetical protein
MQKLTRTERIWTILLAAGAILDLLSTPLEGVLRCDPITIGIIAAAAGGAALKGVGATKKSTATSSNQFEDTSTTKGNKSGRQQKLFKEALDQLFASISAGPQVLQSDRNMMRTGTNNTYNAIAPRLESALTSRGFGQSGKLGSGLKDLEISRANQIQVGEAGLQRDAQQRFQQMLALALPYTRPDDFTTTRSGSSTGSATQPGLNNWSAAGQGLGDLAGLFAMFGGSPNGGGAPTGGSQTGQYGKF